MSKLESQQVAWWPVHEFALPKLQKVPDWPLLGTPPWCALDDRDPVKWAAILDAARHWALRLDTLQEARAEASRSIAEGEDWARVASQMRSRAEFYTARPWMKRTSA